MNIRNGALLLLMLLSACDSKAINDRPWALPGFEFDLVGPNANYLSVQGTLIGADVGYKVNTYTIGCDREKMTCQVADVEEIGKDQLGIVTVSEWPITTWTDALVIAQDGGEDTTSCALNVLTFNRTAKTVAYDSVSKNADKDYCKKFHKPQHYHWSIGQPKQPWEK